MRLTSGIAAIALAVAGPPAMAEQAEAAWKLAIHGGAGVIERGKLDPEREREIRSALESALAAGSSVLEAGGSAVDAVEASVKLLEDDPNFNAGRGAVFTYEGANELDAAIMDGSDRSAGAVAGVSATRHPVSLARAVMDKSAHVFLAGKGADRFSVEQGLEQAPADWFATPERRRQLDELKARKLSAFDVELKYGTVGAVALDTHGHVAAATSTGGLTGKRWGRIGDSPVIGAGTYADDRSCAVSATGTGETFIRVAAAHEICARIRLKGETAKAAAAGIVAEIGSLGGSGGVIVVTPKGDAVTYFNTPGMYRGIAGPGERTVAIYSDE